MSTIPIRPILEFFGFEDIPMVDGRKVRCKFHGDDHPSAVVYETYYKCFACGAQGDAVRLLHDHGELGWNEAQHRAEDLTGEKHSRVRAQSRGGSSLPGLSRIHRGRQPFVPFRRGA